MSNENFGNQYMELVDKEIKEIIASYLSIVYSCSEENTECKHKNVAKTMKQFQDAFPHLRLFVKGEGRLIGKAESEAHKEIQITQQYNETCMGTMPKLEGLAIEGLKLSLAPTATGGELCENTTKIVRSNDIEKLAKRTLGLAFDPYGQIKGKPRKQTMMLNQYSVLSQNDVVQKEEKRETIIQLPKENNFSSPIAQKKNKIKSRKYPAFLSIELEARDMVFECIFDSLWKNVAQFFSSQANSPIAPSVPALTSGTNFIEKSDHSFLSRKGTTFSTIRPDSLKNKRAHNYYRRSNLQAPTPDNKMGCFLGIIGNTCVLNIANKIKIEDKLRKAVVSHQGRKNTTPLAYNPRISCVNSHSIALGQINLPAIRNIPRAAIVKELNKHLYSQKKTYFNQPKKDLGDYLHLSPLAVNKKALQERSVITRKHQPK